MQNWEIQISGERYEGSPDMVREWVMEGRILADDTVRVPGRDWRPAAEVPELKGAFHLSARPAPPPATQTMAPPPPNYMPPPPRRPAKSGMNPATIIIVIALIVVTGGGIIGFSVWKGLKKVRVANYNQLMLAYTLKVEEETAFVQLTLPEGWRPTSGLNKLARAQAVNPGRSAYFLIITEEITNLTKEQKRAVANVPIEKFSEYAVTRFESAFESATVVDRGALTLGGHPAYRQVIEMSYEGKRMKMSHLVIKGIYGVHEMALWTTEDNFIETRAQFDKILDNFREVSIQNYKYAYKMAEIGEVGEIIFLSDNPIEGPTGPGVKDDGEGRGRIETDTDRKFLVNRLKFSVREDGLAQGKNFWPKETTAEGRIIVRLDKLEEPPAE